MPQLDLEHVIHGLDRPLGHDYPKTVSLAGTGRRVALDPRDRILAPLARPERTSRTWHVGHALDQGGTSQCVAYAWTQYLRASPIKNRPPGWQIEPFYERCQDVDEWPGSDYDGTSVRAGAKVLKADGYLGEYRFVTTAAEILAYVLEWGPVVLGTDWTMEMFKPDRWGYIRPEGVLDGGHAYLAIGANATRRHPLTGHVGAIRIMNSWGTGWGDKGRAWISVQDLDYLMRRDGEACLATEVLKGK